MRVKLDQNQNRSQSTEDEQISSHHHRSNEIGLGLFQARHAVTGGGNPIYFGPERKNLLNKARGEEAARLAKEVVATRPSRDPNFIGGEHDVWVVGEPASVVFKRTLKGGYGQILDEKKDVDFATMLNSRKLFLRAALPSEYLLRWAVLNDIFQLPTVYHGQIVNDSGDPDIGISQPYIDQDETDKIQPAEVADFMEAHGFDRVEVSKITLPELKDVTWYRKKDGILITDAFPRNFRKHAGSGFLVPIDLIVTLIPDGGSKVLPNPLEGWKPPASQDALPENAGESL